MLSGATAVSSIPKYDHVVVVVEENHSYKEVLGSGGAGCRWDDRQWRADSITGQRRPLYSIACQEWCINDRFQRRGASEPAELHRDVFRIDLRRHHRRPGPADKKDQPGWSTA